MKTDPTDPNPSAQAEAGADADPPPTLIEARVRPFLAELLGGEHRIPTEPYAYKVLNHPSPAAHVSVRTSMDLSTHDGDLLTRIVILAHKHQLRVTIDRPDDREEWGPGLMIRAWDRAPNPESRLKPHPTLDDLVARIGRVTGAVAPWAVTT